jgi:nucleotide-binding universal stress UspA family protein
MISIQKILVPMDFSDHSAKAVLYGIELALKFSAELHLIHVVAITPIMYSEGVTFPFESQAELEQAASEQLNQVVTEPLHSDRVTRVACSGTPFVEVVRYAKEHQIDLVVMGTHGRGAIAHMLLGSVAERVVRKAPCPVLVVRDEEHDFVMP